MKRKDIKNILNLQLQNKTPKLTSNVTKTPLNSKNERVAPKDEKIVDKRRRGASFMPKWGYGIACAVIVCILALSFGLYFGLPRAANGTQPQTVCYVVDINPSIAITADNNGKVLYLTSQNDEGDIVLASDVFDSYKDMSVEYCVNAIIEQSARLGYLDCDSKNNKVTLTLVGDDSANKITVEELATKAQEFLRKLDVFAFVDTAAKDVKSFVESKGWKYVDSTVDGYLGNIRLQSKYVCGSQYGGDFESEAKDYIDEYYDGIVAKKVLLDKLGEKLDAVEASQEITINYWSYKLVEGTFLAPQLTETTAKLVKECDRLVEELKSMGVEVSGTVDYSIAVAKYAVVEEISKFFDDLREYIYDSSFFNMFLGLVDEDDVLKFQKLKEKIDGYYTDVVSKLTAELKERMDNFSSKFENRKPISDSEYDEFLKERAQIV